VTGEVLVGAGSITSNFLTTTYIRCPMWLSQQDSQQDSPVRCRLHAVRNSTACVYVDRGGGSAL